MTWDRWGRLKGQTHTEPDNGVNDMKDPGYKEQSGDLTPFDIVELLRSPDGDERAKALDWLFPGQPVALIHHYPKTAQTGVATTKTPHIGGLFTSLCFACQHVGNALGMKLDWVKKRDPGDKIVVVTGGVPPPRGG